MNIKKKIIITLIIIIVKCASDRTDACTHREKTLYIVYVHGYHIDECMYRDKSVWITSFSFPSVDSKRERASEKKFRECRMTLIVN